MTAGSGNRNKKMTNRKRPGGNGLTLQSFVNAKSQSSYNPHLIKKQRELYRNAKVISKFKKSVKKQDPLEDHIPPASFPQLPGSREKNANETHTGKGWKKNKKKNTFQIARAEYEKQQEKEEKERAEKEASIRAREEERAIAEGKRKTLRKRMFKRTQSGQPVMKYRMEHLLKGILETGK